jgi:hypothetical protein
MPALLVLVENGTAGSYVQSLSGLVDHALGTVARGTEGERIRKHVVRLEREISSLEPWMETSPTPGKI